MDTIQLLTTIALGETSTVQFKERLDNDTSIAAEMIAMSNTKGGIILFGIKDKTYTVDGNKQVTLTYVGLNMNNCKGLVTDSLQLQVILLNRRFLLQPKL